MPIPFLGPIGPAPGFPGPAPGPIGPAAGLAPTQAVGEQLITQLLGLAMRNPQLLIGLALGGAAREISQLTGLSRRRQERSLPSAMPSAAALLGGQVGDVDRLLALQALMGSAPAAPVAAGLV